MPSSFVAKVRILVHFHANLCSFVQNLPVLWKIWLFFSFQVVSDKFQVVSGESADLQGNLMNIYEVVDECAVN